MPEQCSYVLYISDNAEINALFLFHFFHLLSKENEELIKASTNNHSFTKSF